MTAHLQILYCNLAESSLPFDLRLSTHFPFGPPSLLYARENNKLRQSPMQTKKKLVGCVNMLLMSIRPDLIVAATPPPPPVHENFLL